jgi:hypothetical protein
MVSCSSTETFIIKNLLKNLAGPPVYYTGSNEPRHARPQFEWPDNTSMYVLHKQSKFEFIVIVSLTEMIGLYSVLLIVHQGLISPLPFFLCSGSVSVIPWSKENSRHFIISFL